MYRILFDTLTLYQLMFVFMAYSDASEELSNELMSGSLSSLE